VVNVLRQTPEPVRRLEYADRGGDVRHVGTRLSDPLFVHVNLSG
jgi:hypothetical protein